MNPPTEQLIRDYLNRLSVAARSRLGYADRQALLDQTRARIEAEAGGLSAATPVQVRQALAALGDPIALVENERTRIAARKETAIGGRFGGLANSVVRQVWPPLGAARTHAAILQASGADPVFDLQVPGKLPVTGGVSVPAALSLSEVSSVPEPPVVTAGLGGPAAPSLTAGRPASAGPPVNGSASGTAALPGPGGSSVPGGPSLPDRVPAPGGEPGRRDAPDAGRMQERNGVPPKTLLPRPAPSPESLAGAPVPAPDRPGLPGPDESAVRADKPSSGRDKTSSAAHGSGGADDGLAHGPEPAVELSVSAVEPGGQARGRRWLAGPARTAAGRISQLGSGLLALARRDRLEAIAVVLLGIGGAVYPPIWVIGAFVAVSSKKWDLRDKWLGIALPVLLVIFGAVLVIALGGQRQSLGSYAFEAWLAAGRLSRIAAVLGAGYLLRRVYRGKRKARRPPWPTH